MALDRTWYNTLVDDDGSNLVGSLIDKADIDALMDAIDAALAAAATAAAPAAVVTTWTPVDGSGAALTFTVVMANAIKIGRLVHVDAQIVYPTTASGASAKIGGLPYVPSARSGVIFGNQTGGPTDLQGAITNGVSAIELQHKGLGTPVTNAQVTGMNTYFSATYLTP